MRSLFLRVIPLGALSLGALVGCAGPEAPADPAGAIAPALPNSVMFGKFVAHLDKKAHTMTIRRVAEPQAWGPNLEPESLDSLPIVADGVSGSGPANTVELDTVTISDNYPGQQTVTATVDLRHFYSRSFANVFVQISGVTDANGNPTDKYDALNSDGAEYGLDATHGLWQYTADTAPTGVLAQAPFNVGERDWILNNPDDGNCDYTFVVYGSKGFANYTFSFGNDGYTDACSGGTVVAQTSKPNITLPFDFTLYNTNTTRLNIAYNGQMTFGTTALTASGTSVALPSSNAPHPVFFPFWDNLAYGTGGQMCYQTLGSAPNRQFVVEWRNMNFKSGVGVGSNLDFEAFLYEGTGEIDTVYNTMTGTTGRESGSQATVGMQDETGANATQEHDVEDYATGYSWSYIPSPI